MQKARLPRILLVPAGERGQFEMLPNNLHQTMQAIESRPKRICVLLASDSAYFSYDSTTVTSQATVKVQAFFLARIPALRPAYRDASHQRHNSFAASGRLRFYRPERQEPEAPPGAPVWFAAG